jgi:vacuolar-type H+-ATPase catalytic subunit A/Vma1
MKIVNVLLKISSDLEKISRTSFNDLDIVSDIMHNSIEHLSKEETLKEITESTNIDNKKAKEFVNSEYANYLRGKYLKNKTEDDYKLLQKYFE